MSLPFLSLALGIISLTMYQELAVGQFGLRYSSRNRE